MTQTIEALWYGNLAPSERCGAHDGEGERLLHLMERNRERLWEVLTAGQREILQKYIDCAEEYQFRMLELAFRDGFRLGSKLTAEALL